MKPWNFSTTVAVLVIWTGWASAGPGPQQVPTTLNDFFLPGTQPFDFKQPNPPTPIASANGECSFCHGFYDPSHAPWETWKTSIMSQAARDPLMHAALSVANQDVAFSGDLCLRCHVPKGWVEGRSTPTDGSAIQDVDFEGVTCCVCHRMIDPVYEAGVSPLADVDELNAIGAIPTQPHDGQYVIDRQDRRRGPFDLGPAFAFHQWLESPFHREAMLCSTCHEVSNPVYERQGGPVPAPGDTYVLGTLDAAHSTQSKYDMFPLERTFSEWSQSDFEAGPIEMGGRFGGNITAVSTCQDCHMPDVTGTGCSPVLTEIVRDDLPRHRFSGAANWVLDAILELDQSLKLYGEAEASGLTQAEVDEAKTFNLEMLENASDLELTLPAGDTLNARVVNFTGHKLPSGYPDGRRMWLNVKFLGDADQVVDERGAYDNQTATLETSDTKIYEAILGLDSAAAALTGLPEGESFHTVLNNTYLKDNRIPPMGFTNAGFEAVQAAPVAYSYNDGQHWDDTAFSIPCGAVRAEVALRYQTSSREYIEFLRDESDNGTGQILHDVWAATGMGAPVTMDMGALNLPDCNLNGQLDACDVANGPSDDDNINGIPDECEVCTVVADCCDLDGNQIRDDACRWCACDAGSCTFLELDPTFADMGGAFGSCAPDGFANLFDRSHALTCFAGVNTCASLNIDAGGAFGACAPDGFCNIFDANHALTAFANTNTCTCPPAPAPQFAAVVAGRATLQAAASAKRLHPGGGVDVAVWLDLGRGSANLQSYQMHVGASGGHRGRLELVDVRIDERPEGAFANSDDRFDAVNVGNGQMLAGVIAGEALGGRAYLATFRFRASADALGRFVVDVLHDENAGDQTFLVSNYTDRIEIDGVTPAVIDVSGSRLR